MDSDYVIKWEIVRGISSSTISDFMNTVMFTEEEIDLPGIVQMIIDGRQDENEYALKEFISSRQSDYVDYIMEISGSSSNIPYSTSAIRSYVNARGLENEYNQYVVENRWRWNGEHIKNEVREMIVDERIVPLFEQMSRNDMYIFRDKDHVGVHFERILNSSHILDGI